MENRATGTCTLFEQDDIKELLESDDIILTLALALTKTLVSRESAFPPFFFFFSYSRAVARYFMLHAREYAINHVELNLTNF